MSMKAIPSFGALTPVESMLKGGDASDVLNPMNIISDTKMAISKPSSLLVNPWDSKSNSSATSQKTAADEQAASRQQSENNKLLNWTPSRSTGLSV